MDHLTAELQSAWLDSFCAKVMDSIALAQGALYVSDNGGRLRSPSTLNQVLHQIKDDLYTGLCVTQNSCVVEYLASAIATDSIGAKVSCLKGLSNSILPLLMPTDNASPNRVFLLDCVKSSWSSHNSAINADLHNFFSKDFNKGVNYV